MEGPEASAEELISFTIDQVISLSGVSRRQVTYWVDTGLIQPTVDREKRRGRVRLFSFGDLLEVRIAAWLRGLVSLQLIRKIVAHLQEDEMTRTPLASVRFGVFENVSGDIAHRDVVMQRQDGRWESAIHAGQLVLEIDVPIQSLRDDLERKIRDRRSRQKLAGGIERRRGVLGSATVLAGTRVPTAAIWRVSESGWTIDQILKGYPGLTRKDVKAALEAERRQREPA